jgi:hypothetical protein
MKNIVWIFIVVVIVVVMAFVANAQESVDAREQRTRATEGFDSAVKEMNQSNAWAEYLKTGKTNIPKAVRMEIGKEFTRGKGFRIIKGEKVQVRTSPMQRRALKIQGGRK